MRSLFLKIFSMSMLLVLLLMSSVLLLSFRLIRVNTIDVLVRDLERQARLLEPDLISCLEEGDSARLNSLVRDIGERLEIRVTVIAPDGLVLADSLENAAKMENHRFRPEIQEALEMRPGRAERTSRTLKADMLYVGWPLVHNGKTAGVLRLSSFVRDINRMLSGLRAGLGRLAAAATLVAALLAFIVARSLTRPVRRMIHVSRRIARGDFQAKAYSLGRDELGELGRSLNSMTEQLGSLVENLRLQREELNGVLESMQEGLVLIDRDDRIRLSNDSFKKIINQDGPEGAYYWEVVRNSAFADLIRRVREKKVIRGEKIEHGGRVYQCSAALLTRTERTLAVWHDQTEAARLEQLKKDLVVSMSHELRTPLAAVKGYLETLGGEVTPQGRGYLDIVSRNTDRLIKIVDDLLVLSEIEGREEVLTRESVDLKALAADSLKLFEATALGKGVRLRLETLESPMIVEGDAFRLGQMFVNLLDNAVKYTDSGEVLVILESEPERVVLRVRDTGPGIPQEHLPRLFERFYVVDPSRSRKMGGTGLGLAIVKHIALLHGGDVTVSSSPGRGSCFTVTLPRPPYAPPPTGRSPAG
ncbi:MAG: hypothetical protein A2Y69_09540 [Candidatus Aminicenantes bacterium RBG_13_59_9]|nr:MAG: hypothetical protein A2Y69_09540 [Candidatus Aminicenantes bacterium RBG_13_59_9]